jgi:hypothetical protein
VCDVIWLQGPLLFVDLRVEQSTGVLQSCFAGTASRSPPCLTWTHDLDLVLGATDRGEMSWDGDDLIERGVAAFPGTGGPVPYVERWRRLADDRPVQAELVGGGVQVCAGRHSLAIVPTRTGVLTATYRQLGPAGWHVERHVESAVQSR